MENVDNIDKDDVENPQLVVEYVNEIYEYLRQLETLQGEAYFFTEDHKGLTKYSSIFEACLTMVFYSSYFLRRPPKFDESLHDETKKATKKSTKFQRKHET